MIVTVTLNPALDKTAELPALLPGGLNRLQNLTVDAGGKGVNVSKMVRALGGESIATGFCGGGSGQELLRRLEELSIPHRFVPVQSAIRTNLKIVSPAGVTEFNEPGVRVCAGEVRALRATLLEFAQPGTLFVLSGSLPPGADAALYGTLARELRQAGAHVFLDADGDALRLALAAPPHFIKPNREELMEYFSLAGEVPLPELRAKCKTLLATGVELVALSLGAGGALFVTRAQALYAPGLAVKVRSTVGAGDSMVGALAFAVQAGLPLREAAALSVAASAGAVTTTGTNPPTAQLVKQLQRQVKLETI